MATQSTSSQQTPWGKIFLVVLAIVVLISWVTHKGPFHRNYTLTANFPGVQIQLTPITPPKALSTLPSDYVQVVVKVGTLTFSTDDPQYQCLESLVPLFFQEETVFPKLLLVVYPKCGQLLDTEHHRLVMRSPFFPTSGDLYIMFTAPRDTASLCSTSSSQCIVFEPPTPTPLPPTPTPIPTVGTTGPSGQSVDPTAANIITNAQMTSGIDTQANPTNPTTSFQVNQAIYATFDLHLPSDSYFMAKWYEDGSLLATVGPKLFKMAEPRGYASYPAGYPNPGGGTIELYWCTQPDCSDGRLAAVVNFTVA